MASILRPGPLSRSLVICRVCGRESRRTDGILNGSDSSARARSSVRRTGPGPGRGPTPGAPQADRRTPCPAARGRGRRTCVRLRRSRLRDQCRNGEDGCGTAACGRCRDRPHRMFFCCFGRAVRVAAVSAPRSAPPPYVRAVLVVGVALKTDGPILRSSAWIPQVDYGAERLYSHRDRVEKAARQG